MAPVTETPTESNTSDSNKASEVVSSESVGQAITPTKTDSANKVTTSETPVQPITDQSVTQT